MCRHVQAKGCSQPMNQPIWQPSADRISRANLNRFLRFVSTQAGNHHVQDHAALHDFSIHQAQRFWPLVWEFCGIRAGGNWDEVLVDGDCMQQARWFPEVTLNHAQNLLRHRDDRAAIIERRANGSDRQCSYRELNDLVARVAGSLAAAGIVAGQRVAAVMPAGTERIVAALAVTSLGGIWASLPEDVDPATLQARLTAIEPAMLIAGGAAATAQRLHDLRDLLEDIGKVVIVDDDGAGNWPGSLSWSQLAAAEPAVMSFSALPFDHPLYITWDNATAQPLVQGAGGTLIQHLKELVLHTDLKREDRIWCDVDADCTAFNWLMASLAVGATIVLGDEPADPTGPAVWQLVDELSVSVLGRQGAWIGAQRRTAAMPREHQKLTSLKTLLVQDGAASRESWEFVYANVKERLLLSPLIGLADTGSCLALGNPLQPAHAGAVQSAALGLNLEVLDDAGQAVRGQPGAVACMAPFPGLPSGFWGDAGGENYRQRFFSAVPGAWSNGLRGIASRDDGIVITAA